MDLVQQNIIKYSSEILDYLLKFKDKNPEFTFSLRQRDFAKADSVKRLEVGQWFQGSDYIYIPLFKKGDNARKVKTIGFVILFDNSGDIKKNSIEISFKTGTTDEKEIAFHRELAKSFEIKLNQNNHGEKLFDDQNDIYNNLNFFITKFRNKALKLIEQFDIGKKYIISEADFQKSLNRIEQIKPNEINNNKQINYWLLALWDDHHEYKSILNNSNIFEWGLRSMEDKNPKKGDCFILFDSEKNISYGYGYVTSNPEKVKQNGRVILGRSPKSDKYVEHPKVDIQLKIFSEVNFLGFKKEILNLGRFNSHKQIPSDFYEILISKFINYPVKDNPLNQIIYGPPGTGKTYNSINKSIEIVNPAFDLSQDRILIKKEYDRLVAENQILFTTFHQNMSYEDFIEGIKPETKDKNVIYDVVPGLFLEICTTAENNWEDAKDGNSKKLSFEESFLLLKEEWFENEEIKFPLKREGNDFTIIGFTKKSIQFKKASGGTGHTLSIGTLKDYYYNKKEIKPTGVGIYYPSILEKLNKYQPKIISEKAVKNYVIIIDEINRGNVSQIFGELITLIEDSKRLGNDEALEVILPYSKDKFGVPPNLYIIGTMNTADRSVEALDTALRRRFSFEEMPPRYDLKELENEVFGYQLKDILKTINKRIVRLLNNDHAIGHSYFLNKNEETLMESFYKNIIPLLQEYFFGDYGKMRLVLGDGFIQFDEWNEDDNFFASVADSKTDYDIKDLYSIIEYKQDNKVGFSDALSKLMNR